MRVKKAREKMKLNIKCPKCSKAIDLTKELKLSEENRVICHACNNEIKNEY